MQFALSSFDLNSFIAGIITSLVASMIVFVISSVRNRPNIRVVGWGSGQTQASNGEALEYVMIGDLVLKNDPSFLFFLRSNRETARLTSAALYRAKGEEVIGTLLFRAAHEAPSYGCEVKVGETVHLITLAKLPHEKKYFLANHFVNNVLQIPKRKLSGTREDLVVVVDDKIGRRYKFKVSFTNSSSNGYLEKPMALSGLA
jgi:hypothetical protein